MSDETFRCLQVSCRVETFTGLPRVPFYSCPVCGTNGVMEHRPVKVPDDEAAKRHAR